MWHVWEHSDDSCAVPETMAAIVNGILPLNAGSGEYFSTIHWLLIRVDSIRE
jgi:hypothetical protein